MKRAFILFLLMFSLNVFGKDEIKKPEIKDFKRNEVYFLIGLTTGGESNAETSFLNKTTISNDKSDSTTAFGLDWRVNIDERTGFSFLFDNNEFKYSSGGGSDQMLFAGIGPVLKVPGNEKYSFFGTFGIGYLRNTLYADRVRSGSVDINFSNPAAGSFAYSPRFGVDFQERDRIFRVQAEYLHCTLNYDFSVYSSASGALLSNGNSKFDRSLFIISIGISL